MYRSSISSPCRSAQGTTFDSGGVSATAGSSVPESGQSFRNASGQIFRNHNSRTSCWKDVHGDPLGSMYCLTCATQDSLAKKSPEKKASRRPPEVLVRATPWGFCTSTTLSQGCATFAAHVAPPWADIRPPLGGVTDPTKQITHGTWPADRKALAGKCDASGRMNRCPDTRRPRGSSRDRYRARRRAQS